MEIIPKLYLNYGIILNYLTILRLYSIVLISEALRVDRYLHIHMYMYLVFPGGAVVKKKKKLSWQCKSHQRHGFDPWGRKIP